MTRFDLTPLFRTTVGFDSLFRLFDEMADAPTSAYPPYNIEKLSEDRYRISMAVAGFSEDDLTLELKQNLLTVQGRLSGDSSAGEQSANDGATRNDNGNFLHRGIAERAFSRQFSLAEHVRVAEARLANGLLHIELLREVPEEAKARRIPISAANDSTTISATSESLAKGSIAKGSIAKDSLAKGSTAKQTLGVEKKSA